MNISKYESTEVTETRTGFCSGNSSRSGINSRLLRATRTRLSDFSDGGVELGLGLELGLVYTSHVKSQKRQATYFGEKRFLVLGRVELLKPSHSADIHKLVDESLKKVKTAGVHCSRARSIESCSWRG